MILYMRNHKESTGKKALELINEFINAPGYKINIQKSTVFLYSINEQTENSIKKTISFIIALKRKNILWKKLNKTSTKLLLCEL